MSEPKAEESTKVQVGHKDGRVVLNLYGTSEVEPSYIAWSPAQAREVAAHLVRCAAEVEALERRCGEEYGYHAGGFIGPGPAPHNAKSTCSLPKGHEGPHRGEEYT